MDFVINCDVYQILFDQKEDIVSQSGFAMSRSPWQIRHVCFRDTPRPIRILIEVVLFSCTFLNLFWRQIVLVLLFCLGRLCHNAIYFKVTYLFWLNFSNVLVAAGTSTFHNSFWRSYKKYKRNWNEGRHWKYREEQKETNNVSTMLKLFLKIHSESKLVFS